MFRPWRPGITVSYREDGSVHGAVCFDTLAFLEHGDDLMRELAPSRLDLGKVAAHVDALAGHPALRAVRSLVLHDLGDPAASRLARVALPSLRELVVAECGLAAAGLAALLRFAPAVEVLDVSKNAVGDAGVLAIAAANLAELAELAMSGCHIEVAGARSLSALRLRRLDLGCDRGAKAWWNRIGADGARALAQLPRIDVLVVAGNAIGADGAEALARLAAPGPVDLDVRDDLIDARGATALAAAPWPRLQRIGLSANHLHGTAITEWRDYDNSVVGQGPSPLTASEIGQRFGFAARGVKVY